jgi:diacylglycerol kinase (ATP)
MLKNFYASMDAPTLTAKTQFLPPPRHVVALINPLAGSKRGQQVIHFLRQRQWGAEITIFETQPYSLAGHHAALAFARQIGADRLLISGGDGTLMETLTVMFQSGQPIPISMIRAGTGNIVASDLNTPRRLLPAIRQAFAPALAEWWDLGRLEETGQIFALRASCGHDALTLTSVQPQAKQRYGTFAYALPAIREMRKMKPIEFTLAIDDQPPLSLQGVTAFVAVTNRMAGIVDFVLSHEIHTSDGVLHVGVINAEGMLYQLPHILNQKNLNAKGIVTTYAVHERVIIQADPAQLCQVDGELLKLQTPLTVTTLPQAMPFVTPLK